MLSKTNKKNSNKDKPDPSMIAILNASMSDISKALGPISPEKYDYYMNLESKS
jgi:hypothetical protein